MRASTTARAAMVARKARLREAGLCVDCGVEEAVEGPRGGKRYCEACRRKQSLSMRKHRNRKVDQQPGICLACLKRPATRGARGGRVLCDHCRELQTRRKMYGAAAD